MNLHSLQCLLATPLSFFQRAVKKIPFNYHMIKEPLVCRSLNDIPNKSLEAVFISDLHLHPAEPLIYQRFERFIEWAANHSKALYILGDFFNTWAGDDELNDWSLEVAKKLNWLSEQQVTLYFMPGNRDFLLGSCFLKLANMTLLKEPTLVKFNDKAVLLVHGDRYCVNDKKHQYFRRLTRAKGFARLFLSLPLSWRVKVVGKVRQHSQLGIKAPTQLDVIPSALIAHMQEQQSTLVIHGHIHKPGLTNFQGSKELYQQYVLSDWDDNPILLCYDKSKGFSFIHFC